MKFLTDEKLVISGAGGMIGSNMAQTAIMMGLTSNICLYDVYMPGLEGVVEELRHCAFPGVNITYTDNVEEAILTPLRVILKFTSDSPESSSTFIDIVKSVPAL